MRKLFCASIAILVGALIGVVMMPIFAAEPPAVVTTPYVWSENPSVFAAPSYQSAPSDHQPPRFLPAVVLYDKDNRFIALQVGKTFAYSCKGALDDAQATIEKATAAGRRLVGLCIPVPTYSAADLVPAADPPKAEPDNAV